MMVTDLLQSLFISLHIYWISGIAPAGLETMGAGHPEKHGLCHLRVSVSLSVDALHIHRPSDCLLLQFR